MKRVMATGSALIMMMGGFVAAQTAAGRSDVIAAQQRFAKSHKVCDPKEMADVVTDDILWVHPDGVMEKTKTEVVKSHANPQSPLCPWEEWKVDVQDVNIYGDAAVVFGTLSYNVKGRSLPLNELAIMQTFVKKNGRWLLAASETTSNQGQKAAKK